ncbi:MAG: histidine kinase [Bacteroidota bacterium]
MFGIEQTYDRWSPERISRHLLYWLLWLLFFTMVNGSHYDNYGTWFMIELHFLPIKLLVTYTIIYVLVPRYLVRGKYLPFLLGTLGLAIPGGVLLRVLEYFYLAEAYDVPGMAVEFINFKFIYRMLDLVYTASLPTGIKLLQRNLRQERNNTQLTKERIGAELQLLKNQLQPHFLFNTLNNLYGMVLTQSKKAPEVVLGLSELLSYMLYECQADWVSLDKEADQIARYLALEHIRYDARLRISFDTEGELHRHQIAPMLLFPFVENAVKHGAASTEEACWINGQITAESNEVTFSLRNSIPQSNGAGPQDLRSGIGLANVRKRLDLLYPGRHTLDIDTKDSYAVHLKIQTI